MTQFTMLLKKQLCEHSWSDVVVLIEQLLTTEDGGNSFYHMLPTPPVHLQLQLKNSAPHQKIVLPS